MTGQNSGSADDKRAAMKAIGDYANGLVIVAVGTLALSTSLLGTAYAGRSIWTLYVGWGSLAGSLVAGLLALGEQISMLAKSDLRPRRAALETMSLIQLALVIIGLAFLGYFAVQNVTVRH